MWYPPSRKRKENEKKKEPEFLSKSVNRECTKCGDTFISFRAKPSNGYNWLCPHCWGIESVKSVKCVEPEKPS